MYNGGMTAYMKKGLMYGIAIVLILVGLFVWKPIVGLLVLALAGAWIWNYDPPYEIDADLRASTKEIVKEVDPVPETSDGLPFIENEGTDPKIAGEAAMRQLSEAFQMATDEQKEHIFSAADNQQGQPR